MGDKRWTDLVEPKTDREFFEMIRSYIDTRLNISDKEADLKDAPNSYKKSLYMSDEFTMLRLQMLDKIEAVKAPLANTDARYDNTDLVEVECVLNDFPTLVDNISGVIYSLGAEIDILDESNVHCITKSYFWSRVLSHINLVGDDERGILSQRKLRLKDIEVVMQALGARSDKWRGKQIWVFGKKSQLDG